MLKNEVPPCLDCIDVTPPDSPEFYGYYNFCGILYTGKKLIFSFAEVPEGPNLSLHNPVVSSINLEDAVLESRRFAADRIRNSLKNMCVWHPQNNWLASTSDGPDALIWMLPSHDEIKGEKLNLNESKLGNLSDSLRRQNRRVALDHSNDPVFRMAWNVRNVIPPFVQLSIS